MFHETEPVLSEVSIHPYQTKDGTRFRVRWRGHDDKLRSKSFLKLTDAKNFEADVKARKFRLEALPAPTDWTLDRAWEEWKKNRGQELALATLDNYESLWNAYVKGGFGATKLALLAAEPMRIEQFNAQLREGVDENGVSVRPKVGASSRRKLLMVVSAVMRACVAWGRIPSNPVRDIPKPSAIPKRPKYVFSAVLVERIRSEMLRREALSDVPYRREADACLVSLMAYGGLRPQEALALTFGDIEDKRIKVWKALTDARPTDAENEKQRAWHVGPTKTRKPREVPLADAVRTDLLSLSGAMGDPPSAALVFPGPGGGPWRKSAYSNWRARVWLGAVKAVARTNPKLKWLEETRPYDCRRSFVSLHLHARVSPLEIARDAGHSPEVMFRHCSSLIDDLAGLDPLPVDEQVENARKLIRERPADVSLEVLTVESMKPPRDAAPVVANLLYGPRVRINPQKRPRRLDPPEE